MGATAGAQSWSGTLVSTEKPPSKLPVLVGVGALAIAALGAGGFVFLRAPQDRPRPGSIVLDATAGTTSAAAAAPVGSTSPTIVPADVPSTTATAKPNVGTSPARPGASSAVTAQPSATTVPVASATPTAPTSKPPVPTATATATSTVKPPNDVWNNPD